MRRKLVLLLVALAAPPASAQPGVPPASTQSGVPPAPAQIDGSDDETAAFCLGVNRQLVERFRRMQLWGCGKGPDMAWCREAKAGAPDAMRHRERLVIRFAAYLSDRGLLDVERPVEARRKVAQLVDDGSQDAARCFNEKGEKDEAACERLQRCEAAERLAAP